jgi:hypothetical protein
MASVQEGRAREVGTEGLFCKGREEVDRLTFLRMREALPSRIRGPSDIRADEAKPLAADWGLHQNLPPSTIAKKLLQFKLAQVFTEAEVAHWFLQKTTIVGLNQMSLMQAIYIWKSRIYKSLQLMKGCESM